MKYCPSCGFPLEKWNAHDFCPKCGEALARRAIRRPMVRDVAHHGETAQQALTKLEQALNDFLVQGCPSLKVIHGHGSHGSKAVIRAKVVAKMRQYADRFGLRLEQDGTNEGAHILFLS